MWRGQRHLAWSFFGAIALVGTIISLVATELFIGSRFGVRAVIIAGGLVFAPVVGVFLRAARLRDHVAEERIAIEEAPPAELG